MTGMPKRSHDEHITEEPQTKRLRHTDHISALSDELLLHVLSFLPIASLIGCQRLSRRFHSLAGDSELWKQKYYSRWIWPKTRRMRNKSRNSLNTTRGIDRSSGARVNQLTNWKGEYRLQHNWSKGTCRVTEFEVAGPSRPPIVVKLESGVVFTADAKTGLRAWSTRDPKTCLASIPFTETVGDSEGFGECTAMTITPDGSDGNYFEVTIGFDSGSIVTYSFSYEETQAGLRLGSSHSKLLEGPIAALASCKGYLLTLSDDQTLSLFELYPHQTKEHMSYAPRLIASLVASNIQAPYSLSVRARSENVIASIAYSFPRIGCGWSVGLQEIRWNKNDDQIASRLTSTVESQFALGELSSFSAGRRPSLDKGAKAYSEHARFRPASGPALSFTKPPTSLSYSHPYLITSHADNTLTMYLVVSGPHDLAIKAGHRLWGHTSCVSGVQVSDRGKAISVSRRGNEIRIWELEELASFRPASKKALVRDTSVQLSPEQPRWQIETALGCDIVSSRETAKDQTPRFRVALEQEQERAAEPSMMNLRGWVGFDDERVIVLREQVQKQEAGAQLLDCYDFT